MKKILAIWREIHEEAEGSGIFGNVEALTKRYETEPTVRDQLVKELIKLVQTHIKKVDIWPFSILLQ